MTPSSTFETGERMSICSSVFISQTQMQVSKNYNFLNSVIYAFGRTFFWNYKGYIYSDSRAPRKKSCKILPRKLKTTRSYQKSEIHFQCLSQLPIFILCTHHFGLKIDCLVIQCVVSLRLDVEISYDLTSRRKNFMYLLSFSFSNSW